MKIESGKKEEQLLDVLTRILYTGENKEAGSGVVPATREDKGHSTGRVLKKCRANKNSGHHVGVCGKIEAVGL